MIVQPFSDRIYSKWRRVRKALWLRRQTFLQAVRLLAEVGEGIFGSRWVQPDRLYVIHPSMLSRAGVTSIPKHIVPNAFVEEWSIIFDG